MKKFEIVLLTAFCALSLLFYGAGLNSLAPESTPWIGGACIVVGLLLICHEIIKDDEGK